LIRVLNAYFPARTLLLGISEALLVMFGFVAATIVRLGSEEATLTLDYQRGFLKIFVVAAVFIVCMYYFDLYDSFICSNQREILTRLVQVFGTVCILMALVYYVFPPLQLGRGVFLIGFAFVAVLLVLWRKLFLVLNAMPRFAERALIFGDGLLAESLVKELESRPELGIRIAGQLKSVANGNGRLAHGSSEEQTEKILESFQPYNAARIIVALSERRGQMPVAALLQMKSRGVKVHDGAEVYEAVTGKVPVESLRLSWLLFSSGFRLSRLLLIFQRLISLCVSMIGLVLCLPIIPFIVLGIRLTSPGPILFRQKRVGQGGRVFDCYKFRTMRVGAESETGPTWANKDDPRVTPFGRFLRRSRLDEIPQLWNVLKGDMNLVGPRPERPEFMDWLKSEIAHYDLRHTVRPGLTGWAQIRYRYGSSLEDTKEKLCYDLFYIKNMSAGLDLLVLFHTMKIVLLGRGAR
jgi:sugar transferase (PEP-CTERM system associated)